ncbi:50S ribosomal protein L25/general stress protein Ctc [Gilvimarinus sp. SDUM040013]|uniref:Large ribosomal subunit protein bL25 n=1 Tax=Gilvimarinus gilvus TaxID=3058038 RepID=A0ABU4RZR8_9GAMM|nr:50S ribosomal protein L25/general stress protein Ctc [Gilvimarinus sp. SDUM040013]MDO3386067.1 50S ribosomal protein L25/general stress protein Ctc [Gilvimarinus sp. SDUM040013]MDX6850392.1 50S ribosomal protein L25/general stress protein Ctc [Gilvimarinus sp. SDUM040013]
MSEDFVLNATSREDTGKGASRRLRRLAGEVPAIVYGGNKKPVNISLVQKDLLKQLENEAFYSHIISLKIGEKSEDVILKDLQRHPAKPQIIHADFMRVLKTKKLNTSVPLHFLNEEACKGVKMQGGKIVHNMVQLEVSCLPADLPEFIEVDLLDVELGQVVHISDLKLPKGVSSVELALGSDHDQPVVTVNKPKGVSEDSESEAEEGEGDSE